MKYRTLFDHRIPILSGILTLFTISTLQANTTYTFQNGANSYVGAADFSINTQYAQYNGGNGTQWLGDPELGCYTTTGSDAYSVRYLLKFGSLSIPAGSQVVSATLSLGLDSWNPAPGNITGFYLKNSWDVTSTSLGWLHRDATNDWAGPGASSAGVDTVAGKSFSVPALQPVGPQKVSITLDAAQVQAWVNSPAANQGIMLVNNIPGAVVNPISTVGTQNMRPMLTVVVANTAPVQVTVTPTSTTLVPGGKQTFSAAVSGSSNVGVTWTATGGTITTAGIYTAGATAGSFTATATSTADPTKSAHATVVVQPTVLVTVSPTNAVLLAKQTQQFTATVSGATNKAVTWTATGGTISATGLYTAGTTAGTFSVTATSAADTTKKSSVSVVIQPTVSVTVAPAAATLLPSQTQQFTATVTGNANTAVTWTATGGTITSTGLYTAGTALGATFAVTAKSVADTTKIATAAVTIKPKVTVTLSPTTATILPGAAQQFTASVAGATNTAVTWTATGGTVTSSGLFTAGSTPGAFAVTATSVQDTTVSAKAAVTISAPVSITVAPTSATVFAGAAQQFTAHVSNATNAAVTWTATGGTITSGGLFTAGSTAGAFSVTATTVQTPVKTAKATVTITVPTSADRPRIILNATMLSTLRSRATANTAQWKALKSVCDSMVGGTVNFPGDNGYPDLPNVGEGYQGDGYVAAILPLGLCYQTAKTFDAADAAKYAAKGVAVLLAMSDPGHETIDGTPIQDRDNGYGIRNYGFAMGIGYDWFHDHLSGAQLTQIQNALHIWIDGFETDAADDFEYAHPQSNYFAGYYAAKCMAALAVEGDNPSGDVWWNDWYSNQHGTKVAPYYTLNMAGGGWPEGFANYGSLASRNMALPALAVHSAKSIDLIHASTPFAFPLDQARWAMHFTWPSRDFIDDRDTVHSNDSDTVWPGTPDANLYSFLAGYLAMWNDPLAPMMHKYARDAKAALAVEGAGGVDEWIEFLFWDDTAAEADYSTAALSYVTSGIGEASSRSDWTNAATWMSFRSGPYVNNPAQGHQDFDAGSLALVKGKSPLLVNVEGWLAHNPNGTDGENAVYDDSFGNWDADHNLGNRRMVNTFQVRDVDAQGNILENFGQWAMTRADEARAEISRFEDGGSYVLSVGQFLEDMYRPFKSICGTSPVTTWSRQVLYLRPSQFIVYDRTGVCNQGLDQYLAFHFPGLPKEVTAPGVGLHRFDVTNGAFAGSMTTILPASAALAITDQLAPASTTWGKVWRAEIRPTDAATANRRWLTVFDLAASAAQVATATPITVSAGPAVGTLLRSAAGNSAAIFGTAAVGTPIVGTLSYTVPAAQTRHVIADLTRLSKYTISVSLAGGNHVVTVMPGGNTSASANGVVTFAVTAGGVVQP